MRLFEMSKLPAKAGKAVLEFGSNGVRRIDDVIHIPKDFEKVELFPLKGMKQFLLRVANTDGYQSRNDLWFGGTDESPFLVQLQPEVFTQFVQGGVAGFYEALKPDRIKQSEQAHGPERTRRQGDIFAYPAISTKGQDFDWVLLIDSYWSAGAGLELKSGEFSLLETRHQLDGKMAVIHTTDGQTIRCIEGEIQAEDHAPMTLEGPHIFAQTTFLQNPQLAD